MKNVILLFFIMFSLSCAQTIKLPLSVTWDYNYAGEDNPSIIYFEVFQSVAQNDTSYALIGTTHLKELRLLDYANLYTGNIRYLFCRARRNTDDAISLNSDTISAKFPVIITNQPYQFIEHYIDLKK